MDATLAKDVGILEGRFDGVEARLKKIEGTLERIEERLGEIEATERERKGAWKIIAGFAGAIGAAIGLLIEHYWK